MGKKTTRQHFVPQTYLKNFAHERKNGQFYLYFKNPNLLGNGGTGCNNTINLCVEGGLYDLPGELTDEERTIVDRFYNDAYETGWTSVYEKLVNENVTVITPEDRRLIIGMVSSLYFRNRSWNVFLNQVKADIIERGYRLATELGSDSFEMLGEVVIIKGRSIELIKKEYLERDKPGIILSGVRATINLLRRRIDSDGIEVMKIVNPNEHFLTSDNPVTVRDPDNQHIIPSNPSNFLSLPIDHKHTLLLIPERPTQDLDKIYRSKATDLSIFAWNVQTFGEADRFLMGSEAGLKSFAETINRINKKASAR
jgi:hypothetical protein